MSTIKKVGRGSFIGIVLIQLSLAVTHRGAVVEGSLEENVYEGKRAINRHSRKC